MKFFKWRIFIITSLVCLSPILMGIAMWDALPDEVAIHFNFLGEPDNFASKGFAVFGLPGFLVVAQAVLCASNDYNLKKYGEAPRLQTVTKWILPFMSVTLYVITLGYSLGWQVDIRKSVVFILGIVFLVIGKCISELNHVKNYNLDAESARKINRFVGYEMVFMGVLFIVSIFFSPVISMLCLGLIIPFLLAAVIYSIKICKNKNNG